MAYYGFQGIHTRRPLFRHRDGSVSHERPSDGIIAYHEDCAYQVFNVDRTREGWGTWHHDKGMSWSPGRYGENHPCEHCGKPC